MQQQQQQQQPSSETRHVSYAIRSMAETELGYAQIEKGAQAITGHFEHWEEFLFGMNLLFSTKLMERFRMRFMGLEFATAHFPGNLLCTAGSLCRSLQEGKAKKPESWNDPRQVLYE